MIEKRKGWGVQRLKGKDRTVNCPHQEIGSRDLGNFEWARLWMGNKVTDFIPGTSTEQFITTTT